MRIQLGINIYGYVVPVRVLFPGPVITGKIEIKWSNEGYISETGVVGKILVYTGNGYTKLVIDPD
jgi:hypothetical protein